MIANILNWISNFFQNLTSVVLNFFSATLGSLFQGLINVLKFIFKPIFILIAIIFYVIYKLGELVVALVMVLVAIGKLLYSFVIGLFKTIASLAWTATAPPDHGSWSGAMTQFFAALEPYQLNKIAYVISFVIWVTTAIAVIKILSSRGAADD